MELVPGGYYFMHVVFWTVGAIVLLSTTIVANILIAGLVVLFLERVGKA